MLRGYLGSPPLEDAGREDFKVTELANKTAEVGKVSLADVNAKAEDPLTVIAERDSIQGRIVMKGNGHLLGAFQGEVECDGELLVGKDAQVLANIRTRNIVVAGLVRGNVIASGRLKITSSGRLEGDAKVGSLIVQEGGVHYGALHVHPEGVPEDAPEPAAQAVEPQPARKPVSVDRVKKLWGEFF
jgi:cytoskeletal protein CcmA (bactofilin family)